MAIKYEDLQNANKIIETMSIERKDKRTGKVTSKDYAEVNQRIKAFRFLYPTGCISTEMLSNVDGVCVFKAEIRDEDGKVLGTGTAFENMTSSFINQTSYIENCETSAVGRALAMCGIGIDTSIASYEEVANAIKNQESKDMLPKITEDKQTKEEAAQETAESVYPERQVMLEFVETKYPEGKTREALTGFYKVSSLSELSDAQLIALWNKYHK